MARLWLLALLVSAWVARGFADRPNIVLILADDLGWSDLGCYGGEIRTPHLDALAAGGLRMTQFYNSARCCPSRASLLTGLHPHQAGVGYMTGDRGEAFPGYRGRLNDRCVTLAQVLKSAGYGTAMSGKWHAGDDVSPVARGFDDFYGFHRGYGVDSFDPRMMARLPEGRPQRTYGEGKFFATDAITDHALDFLKGLRGRKAPWFLYVAYQAPHFPVQTQPADAGGYAGMYAAGWDAIREGRLARQVAMGLMPGRIAVTPRSRIPHPEAAARIGSMTEDGRNPAWETLPDDRRADLARRMAAFAGMVTGMDRNIGRIVADLREHGELENTLILFLSDNGACAEWEPFGFDLDRPEPPPAPGVGINMGTQKAPNQLRRGDALAEIGGPNSFISYGSAWANASNAPFRLYKHYCHEGGIRTPLVAHWPNGIRGRGALRSEPGHIVDIMPTLAELAGAKYPETFAGRAIQPMEGASLVPVFRGEALERKAPLCFEHERSRAVRDGRWKAVVAAPGETWELYDMDADPLEMTDLAPEMPGRVKAMAEQWQSWAERANVLPMAGERPARPAAVSRRPNIVTILVDDMGWSDLGCFGGKGARTENIDRLASEGIRFTRFYVNSPLCSPSRVALTTGQYPQRWRITSYLDNRRMNRQRGMAQWLDPAAPVLARELKRAGYATGHFGKWHMGGQRDVGDAPPITAYGFDRSLTNFEGLGPRVLPLGDAHDGKPPKRHDLGSADLGGPIRWEDRSVITAAFVKEAIAFIDEARARGVPFFVNLWPDDVHSPYYPPKDMRLATDGSKRALYLAVLEAMDRQLGSLLDRIRGDAAMRDNTLILLVSDNGPEPGAGTSSGLRGAKGALHEGGVRSPLILWGPGLVAPGAAGTINGEAILSSVDINRALYDITGVALPAGASIDGENVAATLLGKVKAGRRAPIFWRRPPDRPGGKDAPNPDLAVLDGKWKCYLGYDGVTRELYDLDADASETRDVADRHPDVADRLAEAIRAWNAALPADAGGAASK